MCGNDGDSTRGLVRGPRPAEEHAALDPEGALQRLEILSFEEDAGVFRGLRMTVRLHRVLHRRHESSEAHFGSDSAS